MDLPGPLVDVGWLRSHLADRDVVAADVRWFPDGSGRSRYEAGHIPGAVFVDVDADLAAPRSPGSGRHPLPSPESFARSMGRLGIGDEDAVVAYDDAGGANAARLWWMLRSTGHRASVLDGGLQAWDGPLERGPSGYRDPGRFTARPWPEGATVNAAEVDRLRRDRSAVVLDARTAERFRGEAEPIDPVAGHIPGARSAPFAANLDPATNRFRTPGELRQRYADLGVDGAETVVAYCGSGVTACHVLLGLEVAGVRGARLYPGSWSEWIADERRPVATGEEPDVTGPDRP